LIEIERFVREEAGGSAITNDDHVLPKHIKQLFMEKERKKHNPEIVLARI